MSRPDVMLALRVLKRIGQHSISNPITGGSLALEFGTSWRTIASIVEDARDSGHKIGSSKGGKAMGYFLASNPQELHSTIAHMRSQGKKIIVRSNIMANWGSSQPSVFEQIIETPR